MGLGIDLTLLAIDTEPGYLRVGPALPYSLAVAGRITVRGDLIEVLDRSTIGDVLTGDSLARLPGTGYGPSVEQRLERHGPPRSIEPDGATDRRGVRLVTDIVALLALATLALVCLTDPDLAIIIASFTVARYCPAAWT
jgi:hypothetical protein